MRKCLDNVQHGSRSLLRGGPNGAAQAADKAQRAYG